MLCFQGKERILELFCIFSETCLILRGGGCKEPDFSSKNTFVEMSSVQQGESLSLWVGFLSQKGNFKALECSEMDFYTVGREPLSVLTFCSSMVY